MSRARRLAGLPPPKDEIVIISNNNKSSYSSKLVQPIKKIIVPKNLKSSKKSRISFTPKVSPLAKKKDVIRSHQEVNYESNRNMKEKEAEWKLDNDNSLNIDGINEKPKVISQNQNFQVPITPASK